MPLSAEERAEVAALAKSEGVDPDKLLQVVEDELAGGGSDDDPEERAPGKNDAAADGKGAAPAGAESGAKAHGGRGYFAYEYPFLRVNQILASLFLPPLEDGELFSGEWLAKHGGGAASKPTPEE